MGSKTICTQNTFLEVYSGFESLCNLHLQHIAVGLTEIIWLDWDYEGFKEVGTSDVANLAWKIS